MKTLKLRATNLNFQAFNSTFEFPVLDECGRGGWRGAVRTQQFADEVHL
jgi:hypothetical protein